VVEGITDLFALERSGGFHGLYHVLGGALNPIEGVGPEDLNLDTLWPRLAGVKEVVLATSMTVEGEATALRIAEELRRLGIKATRLAYGLPMGGTLEGGHPPLPAEGGLGGALRAPQLHAPSRGSLRGERPGHGPAFPAPDAVANAQLPGRFPGSRGRRGREWPKLPGPRWRAV
jgi:hypothetical protein